MTKKLHLTLACWDYDRVKAIEDGRVQVEGCEINFLNLRVEETFYRQLRFEEFFRQQSIYINKNSGIKKPEDVKGKKVGSPEFQMTAPVWQRGIMEDYYNVPVDSVTYYTGNIEPSDKPRPEKLKLNLPPSIKVEAIPQGKCLANMLADGEIDCLYSATQPSTFKTSENVVHLFPNFKEVEMNYYKDTGIFPIMHVIVIKRSLATKYPWLARSLTKAFESSLNVAYEAIEERGALRYMLPWLQDHVEETRQVMGERWWKDGLEENRKVLETFLQYSHKQGLAKKVWKVEDVFLKSASESFVL